MANVLIVRKYHRSTLRRKTSTERYKANVEASGTGRTKTAKEEQQFSLIKPGVTEHEWKNLLDTYSLTSTWATKQANRRQGMIQMTFRPAYSNEYPLHV